MNYPTTQSSLLEKVQQGDEISWHEFYYRYAPVIRCAGKAMNLCDSECDDLLQLVMLKFFVNGQKYVYRQGKVKFRTYFAKVIHNQAIDMIRRNAARSGEITETVEMSLPFEEAFLGEWRKALLDEAKEELRRRVDEKTYQAFEWYGLQNRPAGQVTEILGMSIASLYTAKSRCTRILKEIIAGYNRNDGELHLEFPKR